MIIGGAGRTLRVLQTCEKHIFINRFHFEILTIFLLVLFDSTQFISGHFQPDRRQDGGSVSTATGSGGGLLLPPASTSTTILFFLILLFLLLLFYSLGEMSGCPSCE